MAFYDMHLHTTLSIGESAPDEAIEFAQRLGLNGIGIVRYYNGGGMKDSLKDLQGDIDIVNAVMLKPKNAEELNALAGKARSRAEILMVHGGDYDINRAACENPLIDILCHPELGRKDSGLDHICAKAAAENSVAIEINFREILESYKKHRVHIIASMQKNVMLCENYGAKIITVSGAVTKWNMRAPRDLAAVANMLGLELGKAIDSVSAVPEVMLKQNRERLAGRRWEGVTIVEE